MTGLYAQNSNHFVRIDNCLIHEPLLEDIRKEVLKILNSCDLSLYDHKTKKGLRYLYLRHLDNSVQMCLVTGNDHLRKEIIDDLKKIKNLKSLYQCVNTAKNSVDIFTNKMIHLYGDKKISFKVEDLKISLSIKSFYQLNTNQAKNLYKKVIEKLDGNEELIVEAYCGVGVMSLLASEKAKEIVGIEYLPEAINNANNNAKVNKISNVSFKCGDAGEMIKKLFKHRHIDTLIVDPPRMGLLDNMIETLLKAKIDKIIYVSCNPATLAKNLNDLSRKYYVESIEAFDMFSATSHVESLTVLKRK